MPDSPNTPSVQTQNAKYKTFLGLGLMILFEIILPIVLYYVLKDHIPIIWALIISGVPPFIIVIYGFIRNRRVDTLGVVILFSFIVSAIVAAVKSDPRLYLLRDSTITGTIGLIFLITLIPIKIGSFQMRPLVFQFAKDMVTGGTFGSQNSNQGNQGLPGLTEDEPVAARWDRYWDSYPFFRRGFITMTAVWGCGLLTEVPIRIIIVFKTESIDRAFLLSNIVTYTWIGVLSLFNIMYSRWFRKEGEKRRAAAAAAGADNQTSKQSADVINS